LQGEQIAAQAELIKRLQDEVAELKRRLGADGEGCRAHCAAIQP
jgi:hypothetical protein